MKDGREEMLREGGRPVKSTEIPTTETAQSFTHPLPRNWGKQVRGMVCVLLLRLS